MSNYIIIETLNAYGINLLETEFILYICLSVTSIMELLIEIIYWIIASFNK
jgi:hypothetical protein